MSVDIEVERKLFEADMYRNSAIKPDLRKDEWDEYANRFIEHRFAGWLAAKRDAAQTKYVPEVKS